MSPLAEALSAQGSQSMPTEEAIEQVHYCECCGAPGILVPSLKCEHCNQLLKIRCYVYQRGNSFYGECLTFNLVSSGATQDEAIRRLQVTMFSYVDAVLQPGKSTKGLIPRRAPLASYVRYSVHLCRARLAHLFDKRYPLATRSQPIQAGEYRVVHC